MSPSPSTAAPAAQFRPRERGPAARATLVTALLGAALALGACGGGGGDATDDALIEPLLARGTIERVGDVGLVEPTETEGFGTRALGGWVHLTDDYEGRRAVLSTHGVGKLRLTAGQKRDRRVELDITRGPGCWDSEEPVTLAVELGGERYELGELPASWVTVAFEVPANKWHEGDNRLTVLVDNTRKMGKQLIALAAVRVSDSDRLPESEPAAAAEDPSALVLGPAEAARMLTVGVDGASLALEVEADGAGELLVHLREINPATGLPGAMFLDEIIFVEGDSEATALLDLPAAAPSLAQLEIRWQPEDEVARARLLRADLYRSGPRPPKLVVFLSVDTLTALNMSLHGYERETTPFLEELAAKSVVFDRAVANCPWTLPSYISQFTAMLPNSHRAVNRDAREDATTWSEFQLASNRLTLAELFNAAGYQTAGIIDNPFLAQLRGLRQGFERLDVTPSTRPHTDTDGGMVLIADTALEWIDAWDRERPLFLFLQMLDVHGPYISVAPWKDAFYEEGDDRGPLKPVADSMEVAVGGVPEYVAEGLWTQGYEKGTHVPVGALRDAYDEKILEMDARVKLFLEELEERGLRDDVLFVLSADHGEITTQHEIYFRHGPVLEPSIHIPLLIDLPGDSEGRRVADPVSLVDLMPTMADLIGLDPAPFAFHGRSLVPLIDGEELVEFPIAVHTTHRQERAIIYENWKLVHSEPGYTGHLSTVLTYDVYWDVWAAKFPEWARELAGREDLEDPPTYDRQRFEAFAERNPDAIKELRRYFRTLDPFITLYDLSTDPDELIDRAADEPERVVKMLEILKASDRLTRDAAALANVDEFANEMTPEMLAELEKLGYIDPDALPANPGPDETGADN